MFRAQLFGALCVFSGASIAGPVSWFPVTAVPVDSPLALVALAAAVGLIGMRLVKNRSK